MGGEDSLETEMSTQSRILAWEVSWTEEPDGLQFMGLQRIQQDWAHMYCTVPESLAFKGRWWISVLHLSFLIQVHGGEVTELSGMRYNIMKYLWVGNKNLLVPWAPCSCDGLEISNANFN